MENINEIGMALCTYHQTGWPCEDSTLVSTTPENRKLTNLSYLYDILLMKLLVATLTNKEPNIHGLPIVPIMINEHIVKALIDTGAEGTCININIAQKLELKKNGKDGIIKTISDKEHTTSIGYEAKFNWVASNGFDPVDGFMHSFSAIPFTIRDDYDVIVGRDILKRVHMTYDGLQREIIVRWK